MSGGIGRDNSEFPIHAILAEGKRGDRADPISDLQATRVWPHRLDHTRRFVAEPGWEPGILQILPAPEHAFRPIQSDGFHLEADFAFPRFSHGHLFHP